MKHPISKLSHEDLQGHMAWLRSFAGALVRDSNEADDLVQDAFVVLARTSSRVGDVRGFLVGTVRFLSAKRQRSEARRRGRESKVAEARCLEVASPSDALERMDIMLIVLEEVRELPGAQARAIGMRYLDGSKTGEIAKREGIAPQTVRANLSRGLESLRERLDRRFGSRDVWSAVLVPWAMPIPIGGTPLGGESQVPAAASKTAATQAAATGAALATGATLVTLKTTSLILVSVACLAIWASTRSPAKSQGLSDLKPIVNATGAALVSPATTESSLLVLPESESRMAASLSVPESAEGDALDGIQFFVYDIDGNAIANAQLQTTNSAGVVFSSLGETDANGLLVANAPLGELVLARKEGLAATRVWRSEFGWPEVTRIAMERDRVLRGVVLGYGDSASPVEQGVRVAVVEMDMPFTMSQFRAQLSAKDPVIPLTTTASDGTFKLAGLRVGKRYKVYAGGRGWATQRLDQVVDEFTDNVEVPVWRLLGVQVLLQDEQGQPLAVDQRLQGRQRPQWWVSGEGVSGLASSSKSVALAGVSAQHASRMGSHDVLMLFTGMKPGVKQVGPIRYAGRIPTYGDFEAEVYAEVIDGEIPKQVVEVPDPIIERADVKLSVDWPEGLYTPEFSLPVARVVFHDPSAGTTLEVALFSQSDFSSTLKGLPRAKLDVDIIIEVSGLKYSLWREALVVDTDSDEPQIVHFDLRDLPTVEFDLGTDYRTYHGPLMYELTTVRGSKTTASPIQRMQHPPYRIAGLQPGANYNVEMFWPFQEDVAAEFRLPELVPPGGALHRVAVKAR
ncbi:MAG: sigma-70 family RNA polymerase sigma factor [bacterium]|nr:sigma-70 family RNA polymerase sigma factor [bacterium]